MTWKILNCRFITLGILFLILPCCLGAGHAFKGKDYSASPTAGISVCPGKQSHCQELKKDTLDEGWSHKLHDQLWGFQCYSNLVRFDNMNICGGVLKLSKGTCTEDYDNEWKKCDKGCREMHPKLAGDCTKGREKGKERCICFHADIGFCTPGDVAAGDVCQKRGDAFSGNRKGLMTNLKCRNDLTRFPDVTVCAAEPLSQGDIDCTSNDTRPLGNWRGCDENCRSIHPSLGGDCSSSGQCVCISARKVKQFPKG